MTVATVTARSQGRATAGSPSHLEALVGLGTAAGRLPGLTGDAVVLCPPRGAAEAAR